MEFFRSRNKCEDDTWQKVLNHNLFILMKYRAFYDKNSIVGFQALINTIHIESHYNIRQ